MLAALGGVISVAAVLVAVYAATRPPVPMSAGGIVTIGVSKGDSIPAYVARKKAALDAIIAAQPGAAVGSSTPPAQLYALVSFKTYLKPRDLAAVLAGLHVTTVFMRVPPDSDDGTVHLDGEPQTRIVATQAYQLPGDVIARMLAEANEKQQDISDYRALQDSITGDSAADQQLRLTFRQDADVAEREERAYRSLCACVYAAVVNGTPASLGLLGARESVRVVDAVNFLQLDRAVFTPPLPEQRGLADPPQGTADTFP